jgi:hypothetical protein
MSYKKWSKFYNAPYPQGATKKQLDFVHRIEETTHTKCKAKTLHEMCEYIEDAQKEAETLEEMDDGLSLNGN